MITPPAIEKTIAHEGCTLTYTVRGAGIPVVLVQGVNVQGEAWRPQTQVLADECCCVTMDNRGYGKSQPLAGELTVERMAGDVLAVMDTVGFTAAHIVGHSLGGVIAQEIALRAHQRVRSLTLMCTVSRGADATRMTPRMFWLGTRTHVGPKRWRRRAFLSIVMPPAELVGKDTDALAAELAEIFGHDLADQPLIVMQQLNALKRYDATPRLCELTGIPTLVIGAAHDPIARPPNILALAAAIPGARLVEFPNASHGVTIQCAAQINTLLREHIHSAEAHHLKSKT